MTSPRNQLTMPLRFPNRRGSPKGFPITLSGTGAELLQRPEIQAAYLEGGRRG
jgi:hypothetical protein